MKNQEESKDLIVPENIRRTKHKELSPAESVEIFMPVSKMHYSMLTQLLRNPLIFKLKHILGVYDGKSSMSGMVGKAGHETLKTYYGGNKEVPVPLDRDEAREIAMDVGLKYLDSYSDGYIQYGKTGSREKMLQNFTKAMNFYFAEEPVYHNILMCEEKMEGAITTLSGRQLPLPAVGVPDLVIDCGDQTIDIVDTKFVKTFTKYENEDGEPHEDYIKIIQAKFLDRLLQTTKKVKAKRVIFREVKYTENRDVNEPQLRDYIVPMDHDQYDIIFDNLYIDVINFLKNPNAIYLPNLTDPFDGEQAGLLYAQGLLNSDMSDIEVMHKVKDVALVSKKFISSRLDRIENEHLAPEEKIKMRLGEFGIPVEPQETKVGATVTQYRFKVSRGIRMSTLLKHKADIALAIEAKGDIRILAPIPGMNLVGVEVPNEVRTAIKLGKEHLIMGTLSVPIGVDIHGEVCRVSLSDMPHLLIAGATGSGKSITLHAIITALTKQMKPEDMQLVLIDPKRVELTAFAKSKHLHGEKVLYEYIDVVKKLSGLVAEMERRYSLLEKEGYRDIGLYNVAQVPELNPSKKIFKEKLPYIVVVIDEYADFMLRSKQIDKRNKDSAPVASVELLITRLAQMARAVGIHLIIATQRPSVDVITGLIKANFPTRIALTTSSITDSQVILGEAGAEKLTGKGDMLFMHPGTGGKIRLQGFLI